MREPLCRCTNEILYQEVAAVQLRRRYCITLARDRSAWCSATREPGSHAALFCLRNLTVLIIYKLNIITIQSPHRCEAMFMFEWACLSTPPPHSSVLDDNVILHITLHMCHYNNKICYEIVYLQWQVDRRFLNALKLFVNHRPSNRYRKRNKENNTLNNIL